MSNNFSRHFSMSSSGRFYLSRIIASGIGLGALLSISILGLPSAIQPFLVYILAGSIVVAGRIEPMAKHIERFAQIVAARRQSQFLREPRRVGYEMCDWITFFTKNIRDNFVRSGLRLSLWLICAHLAGIAIIGIAVVAFYILLWTLAIVVMLMFAYHVLRAIFFGPADKQPYQPSQPSALEEFISEIRDIILGRHSISRGGFQPNRKFVFGKQRDREILKERRLWGGKEELIQRDPETVEFTDLWGSKTEIRLRRIAPGVTDPDQREIRVDGAYLGDLVRNPHDGNFEFKPVQKKG